MDPPVAALPIDTGPPKPRRRVHWRLAGVLLAAITASTIVLWPDDGDPAPPESAVPTPTAAPSTTSTAAPATAEPGDAPLTPDVPQPAASVEPTADLPPRAVVVVTAEQPFLTRAEAGIGFCVAGVEDACTSVPTSDHRPGNESNQLTLVLPRTFTTWGGDHHDCVDDAPCEIRLWAQDGTVVELSVPVAFAAGDPIDATPVSATPTAELGATDVVHVSLAANATVVVLQCVADLVNGCGSADDFVQQPDGQASLDVTVERRIFTDRGPHDCATGGCELRFILADAHHAESVSLSFDPTSDLGLPVVSVRPTAGLTHGTTVELRTPDRRSGVTGYSLCAPDERVCAHLANRPTSEELVVRLPRWIEDRVEPLVVDCAVSRCVIRTLVDGEVIDTPLDFAGTPAAPPVPTVVLSRTTGERVRTGDRLAIAARGLFVMSADALGPTGVDVRFCERPDAPTSGCVSVVGDGQGLQADGSFTTTVTVPNFERRRSRIGPDGDRTPFCDESCWVVVEPRLKVPGGATEIDIESAADSSG